MHMIRATFEFSSRLSLSTLVSFEFLNGMCFLVGSESADMHWPSTDKLLLMDVSS